MLADLWLYKGRIICRYVREVDVMIMSTKKRYLLAKPAFDQWMDLSLDIGRTTSTENCI